MVYGVICDRQNLKIVQSVVVLDFVSVVDVFPCFKDSAKVRRHDDTMLKLVFIADSNCDISIAAHKRTRVLVASSTLH